MSSSRLAVSGFVRKGQRFVSLPHANGERKEEEETLELGQNGQRAENKQEWVKTSFKKIAWKFSSRYEILEKNKKKYY